MTSVDHVRPVPALREPDRALVSQWVSLGSDGTVILNQGKAELGQGISTALAQIAADQLDVGWTRIRVVAANTVTGPNEGSTSGSRSVMDSGAAVRLVCARARQLLLETAAAPARLSPGELVVVDGSIFGPDGGLLATYWELDPSILEHPVPGEITTAPSGRHRYVGEAVPRLDLPAKLAGAPSFIQDLAPAGMLFGRVVRPETSGQRLVRTDIAEVQGSPGVVAMVHRGNFLGVVAKREEEAVRAAEALRRRTQWEPIVGVDPTAEAPADQPAEELLVADVGNHEEHEIRSTLTASFSRPYLAHASIATSCALARWSRDGLDVWSSTQGVYPLRAALAMAFDLPEERVRVWHAHSAGCYGHTGADDAAFDAAMLAQAVPDTPVQVVWSRNDEFRWEPLGPAMVVDVSAGLDNGGNVALWRQTATGGGHSSRPGALGRPNLIGALESSGYDNLPASTDPPGDGGTSRNALPGYSIPDTEIRASRLLWTPLRTSSLRSLGSMLNVFAIEAMMDDLAREAGFDPVEYRLRHLDDHRARDIVSAAADLAGWRSRTSASDSGWGVGYGRYKNYSGYCAAVARVEAHSDIHVTNLYLAVDVGRVINPDGLTNQIEGGAIQATSWTTREEVRHRGRTIDSIDWQSYPILCFSDVPEVSVRIVPRPEEPSLGAGEIAAGPVAAAIGNAVADALGVRIPDLPLTGERISSFLYQS
jgi:CO/xanthine dehydrogenase Mo-binding subunit